MSYEESRLSHKADYVVLKKDSKLMRSNSSIYSKFKSEVLKKLLSTMIDQYNRIRESYKGVVH